MQQTLITTISQPLATCILICPRHCEQRRNVKGSIVLWLVQCGAHSGCVVLLSDIVYFCDSVDIWFLQTDSIMVPWFYTIIKITEYKPGAKVCLVPKEGTLVQNRTL